MTDEAKSAAIWQSRLKMRMANYAWIVTLMLHFATRPQNLIGNSKLRSRLPLLVSLACALIVGTAAQTPAWAADTYRLRPANIADRIERVRTIVEVEGQLRLNADGSEVKHLPLSVKADLSYTQRTLEAAEGFKQMRLIRHYDTAEAKIKLKDSELTNGLRDVRRQIVVEAKQGQATFFSPSGPLTREELDLVHVPGSGLILAALFPEKAVAIEDRWAPSEEAISQLLGLETINSQDIAAALTGVENDVASISIEGKVAGAVGGVSSDIELKGKLHYDLQKKAVTWLALACKESRAIGHARPGFDVVTKVQMVSAPTKATELLGDKVLAGLPLRATTNSTAIELDSPTAGYRFVYDRRWEVMLDRHDATILRLVDRGDLIAQCNISRLPSLPKNQQLSLEGFQADVKRTLGKNFGSIKEAAEGANRELRILRVVVEGVASELPIRWTYYHVSNESGDRASLVFTMEGSLAEKYAAIEDELLAGFHFTEIKGPTPAEPAAKTAKSPTASKAK